MKRIVSIILFGIFLPSFQTEACAFVPHGYQGIYLHQFGHIYFMLSSIFILRIIIRLGLRSADGWRFIFATEAFFVAWNINTFIGHFSEFWIGPHQIIGINTGWEYFLRKISLEGKEYIYY
ncbi:MAG: hypothetical protein L0Y62_06250, partial [Nitrospirae bacterium]|nr:hypothetical protein [Nitrospirota bacterium]